MRRETGRIITSIYIQNPVVRIEGNTLRFSRNGKRVIVFPRVDIIRPPFRAVALAVCQFYLQVQRICHGSFVTNGCCNLKFTTRKTLTFPAGESIIGISCFVQPWIEKPVQIFAGSFFHGSAKLLFVRMLQFPLVVIILHCAKKSLFAQVPSQVVKHHGRLTVSILAVNRITWRFSG